MGRESMTDGEARGHGYDSGGESDMHTAADTARSIILMVRDGDERLRPLLMEHCRMIRECGDQPAAVAHGFFFCWVHAEASVLAEAPDEARAGQAAELLGRDWAVLWRDAWRKATA